MKRWLLLILLLLPILLFGEADFNALKQELKTASGDRKIEILCKLSDLNLHSAPALAFEYMKLALDLAHKTNSLKNEAYVHGKMGYVYYKMNDLVKAMDSNMSAIEIYQKYPSYPGYAATLDNIARIYEDRIQYSRAFEYYQKCLQIKTKTGDKQGLAELYYSLASVAKYLGKNDLAFDYYQRGIDAEESFQENVRQEYLDKSKLYSSKGDQEKALYYYQLYSSTSDTLHVLFTKANRKKMKEMQLQFDAIREKKEKEAAKLKEEKAETEKELFSANETSKVIGTELIKEKGIRTEKERKISALEKDKLIDSLILDQQKSHIRYITIFSVLLVIIVFLFGLMYFWKARTNKALKKAYAEISNKNEELSNAYQILDQLARRDPLTNLSNRRDMLEKIKYVKVSYERNKDPFSIIMLDIDHFKSINDNYGHDAGDFVLVFIANTVQDSVRKQDFVSRWGGEEFLLLLPDTDTEGGKVVGEKIRYNLASRSCIFNEQEIKVTLTAGVCCYADFNDLDTCLKRADEALYYGKEHGRNQVVIVSPSDENPFSSNV